MYDWVRFFIISYFSDITWYNVSFVWGNVTIDECNPLPNVKMCMTCGRDVPVTKTCWTGKDAIIPPQFYQSPIHHTTLSGEVQFYLKRTGY